MKRAEILDRLRAEIATPPQLRYVRLQVKPRHWMAGFWDDQSFVPLKLGILALLVLLAALA